MIETGADSNDDPTKSNILKDVKRQLPRFSLNQSDPGVSFQNPGAAQGHFFDSFRKARCSCSAAIAFYPCVNAEPCVEKKCPRPMEDRRHSHEQDQTRGVLLDAVV
jgi:hypothetical protein